MGQYIAINTKKKWYDPYNGYTWEAYEEDILEAERLFNEVYSKKGYTSLNTLYYYYHLPMNTHANKMVWDSKDCKDASKIEFSHNRYYTEDSIGLHDTGLYIITPQYQPINKGDNYGNYRYEKF